MDDGQRQLRPPIRRRIAQFRSDIRQLPEVAEIFARPL
jgi:hypothetical protein